MARPRRTPLEDLTEQLGMAQGVTPDQQYADEEEENEGMPQTSAPMSESETEFVHGNFGGPRIPEFFVADTNVGYRKVPVPEVFARQQKVTVYTAPSASGKKDYRSFSLNGYTLLIPLGEMVQVPLSYYELMVQIGAVQPLRPQDWAMYPKTDERIIAARNNPELVNFSR